jgi:hypothetical protein
MSRYHKAFIIWLVGIVAVIGFFGILDAMVGPDQPPAQSGEIVP